MILSVTGRRPPLTSCLAIAVIAALFAAGCGDPDGGPTGNDPICCVCDFFSGSDQEWRFGLELDPEFQDGPISNPRLRVQALDGSTSPCFYTGFSTPPSQWVPGAPIMDPVDREAPTQPGCESQLPPFQDLRFTLEYESVVPGTQRVELDKKVE